MEIKLFTKKKCDKCVFAKDKLKELGLVDACTPYDVDTDEGLAESMIWSVSALPAIIVVENDLEVLAWRGGQDHRQPLLGFLKELQKLVNEQGKDGGAEPEKPSDKPGKDRTR